VVFGLSAISYQLSVSEVRNEGAVRRGGDRWVVFEGLPMTIVHREGVMICKVRSVKSTLPR
jgi:hypothetical protein